MCKLFQRNHHQCRLFRFQMIHNRRFHFALPVQEHLCSKHSQNFHTLSASFVRLRRIHHLPRLYNRMNILYPELFRCMSLHNNHNSIRKLFQHNHLKHILFQFQMIGSHRFHLGLPAPVELCNKHN